MSTCSPFLLPRMSRARRRIPFHAKNFLDTVSNFRIELKNWRKWKKKDLYFYEKTQKNVKNGFSEKKKWNTFQIEVFEPLVRFSHFFSTFSHFFPSIFLYCGTPTERQLAYLLCESNIKIQLSAALQNCICRDSRQHIPLYQLLDGANA